MWGTHDRRNSVTCSSRKPGAHGLSTSATHRVVTIVFTEEESAASAVLQTNDADTLHRISHNLSR